MSAGCAVEVVGWSYYAVILGTLLCSLVTVFVKSIPPNTENSMQYGYDENDNNNMSSETKRETNYRTTKWNDVNTHKNMQLTKYDKYTNDDVLTDACVVHMTH